MSVNRFWGSVGSVAACLFAIGLLQVILLQLLSLLSFLSVLRPLILTIVALVPIVGAVFYLDWRWGWNLEHIGLPWDKSAVLPGLVGLGGGAAAAVLAHLASTLLAGNSFTLASFLPAPFSLRALGNLIPVLVEAFAVELLFRGVVISRYMADMEDQEAVLAGTLTPFVWAILAGALMLGMPSAGIDGWWQGAMSVCLSLLFIRFNSVWLTSGLRIGMLLMMELSSIQVTQQGGFLVWGIVAAALVVLEWNRLKHTPRPVGSRQGPYRRDGGRTFRGPWGPH